MYPKIAAIMINYAAAEDTIECIKSLRRQTYPALDIIVVDNASPDNSGKMLKKELEGICTVLLSKETLVFPMETILGWTMLSSTVRNTCCLSITIQYRTRTWS